MRWTQDCLLNDVVRHYKRSQSLTTCDSFLSTHIACNRATISKSISLLFQYEHLTLHWVLFLQATCFEYRLLPVASRFGVKPVSLTQIETAFRVAAIFKQCGHYCAKNTSKVDYSTLRVRQVTLLAYSLCYYNEMLN